MSKNLIDNSILKLAIVKYGQAKTVENMREECLLLYTSLRTFDRDTIIDKIADIEIMIEQVRIIFGEKEVDERIKFKMNRLETNLKNK
jgi:hypothetical protein